MRALKAVLLGVITTMLGAAASASPVAGRPTDGHIGLQPAVTPVAEQIHNFHNLLLLIIIAITFFVLALLVYVIFRYNKNANPRPAKFAHNTLVEVVWTVVPIIILLVIAIPSFPLLYFQERMPEPDLVVKANGYQWYWGYEYADVGVGEYFSQMVSEDEVEDPGLYLLAVDYPLVVPAGATVVVEVMGRDVIHNWAVPAFGSRVDAIPGRLNQTWFRVDEPGTYYGQCSELCGRDHAFMPIEVRVVPQDVYDDWLAAAAADGGDGASAAGVLASYEAEQAERTRLASSQD